MQALDLKEGKYILAPEVQRLGNLGAIGKVKMDKKL